MRMDLNVLFCFVPAEVPYRKICLCPTEPFPRWKDLSLLYHLTAGMEREIPRIGKVSRLDQKNRSTAASFCLSAGGWGCPHAGEPPVVCRGQRLFKVLNDNPRWAAGPKIAPYRKSPPCERGVPRRGGGILHFGYKILARTALDSKKPSGVKARRFSSSRRYPAFW